MRKVVIVDDEPIIVEGLKRAVDWGKWDCQVVGSAGSGQAGMNLIREVKPDILISDICMPGLDGLTMIAGIKSEFENIQITILTGYRDFDYAQQAIRLGVTRFLLKPSKMDELEEAVTVMTDKLSENAHTPERQEKPEDAEANSFIVKNALAYIEENYRERLKLSDVADHIYVSQWHLSKLLNRETGQSFSEVLNSVRIEKARELLHDPSLRIGDIAEEVGFLDLAHFSRVFKKQTGISANEYRNQMEA